jgi:hypothetical protein
MVRAIEIYQEMALRGGGRSAPHRPRKNYVAPMRRMG